jgi:NAD(P)-dependent dehydrogenase (short-subunit alcohol dehydrogenase family)
MSKRPILAEMRTPEGTRVVLFEDTWLRHILLRSRGIQSLSLISPSCSRSFPTPIIASRIHDPCASASSSSSSILDMTGRTVIVTGANSGIGRAAATAFAGAGARVVLAVRNTEKGRTAAAQMPGQTEVRELDLASLAAVRDFAAAWDGEIDILINNAGVMIPPLARTADGFELQFGTNHLGHFALTNLLLAQISGRVVTVSSTGHKFGAIDFDDLNWERKAYKDWRAYGQSKLANLLFTSELQRRLTAVGSPVLAMAAHPGYASTNLQFQSGKRLMDIVSAIGNRTIAQSEEGGALPTIYAAVADIPGDSFAGPSHFMQQRGPAKLVDRSDAAKDTEVARRLWEVSEELTGVSFPLSATDATVTA